MTAADLAPCMFCSGECEVLSTKHYHAVTCLDCAYASRGACSEEAATEQHNTLSRRAALFPELVAMLRSESRLWDGGRALCGCCRAPLPERTSSLGASIPGDCVTPECDVSRLLKRAAEITPEVQR